MNKKHTAIWQHISCQKAKPQTYFVICSAFPFQTFSKQIENNYSQSKTKYITVATSTPTNASITKIICLTVG